MHKIDQSLFPQLVVVPLLSKHRILTQVAGHHMDVIKILPPLTIGRKEVDYFINALDQTLTDCTTFPGPIMELARNTAQLRFGKAKKRPTAARKAVAPKAAVNGHPPLNGNAITLDGKVALNGHDGRHNGSAH